MKRPLSRSQRGSKGIKGKHILQICVLLGVCIWLIYQVKYSHEKKKQFYEKDDKKSSVLLSESEDGLVKLGRKDLLPGYSNQKENEKLLEAKDEDEEEISHEGEEKESNSKVDDSNHEEEEEEEDGVVDEEDEIDEQDQSKIAGETDKEDDYFEEEKETNHVDEIDMTVDEAREVHYKADDASSAVSHESRILNTEKVKESSKNSNETAQKNNNNVAMSEVEIRKEPILKLGEVESSDSVNRTITELKDSDNKSANSTEAILEASRFLKNETEIMLDRSQEDGAPPAGFSDLKTVLKLEQTSNESDPNITVSANITNKDYIQDESRNSTLESSLLEKNSGSNSTEVKENLRSKDDDESSEKESSRVFSTEQTEEADDTSKNSISEEEMEALTDPQDVRIEGNEEGEEEAIAAERKKL